MPTYVAYDPTTGRIGAYGTYRGPDSLAVLEAHPDGFSYLDVPEGNYLGTHKVDLSGPEPTAVPLLPVEASISPLTVPSGGSITITTATLVEVEVDGEYVGSVPPGSETLTLTGVGTYRIKLSEPILNLSLPGRFTVVVT